MPPLCFSARRYHVGTVGHTLTQKPSEPDKPDITLPTMWYARDVGVHLKSMQEPNLTLHFVSSIDRTPTQALSCLASPTTPSAFLSPTLQLPVWSQAGLEQVGHLKKRRRGSQSQQELSLPVVSMFTNHIRLKYDTRSFSWKEGDIFT